MASKPTCPFVSVPYHDLHRRLRGAGHRCIKLGERHTYGIRVEYLPGMIITVALDEDLTVRPAYRHNYYLWQDPLDGYFRDCVEADAGADRPTRCYEMDEFEKAFIGGPVRWAVKHLIAHGSAVIWPARREEYPNDVRLESVLLAVPDLSTDPAVRQAITEHLFSLSNPCALLVDLSAIAGEELLYAASLLTYREDYDFYFATPDCIAVFLIHHHSKLVIMIPDDGYRAIALQEVREVCFEVSGYEDDYDDPES